MYTAVSHLAAELRGSVPTEQSSGWEGTTISLPAHSSTGRFETEELRFKTVQDSRGPVITLTHPDSSFTNHTVIT